MRCVDVIGKLSNWSEPCEDPAVADHLAGCPRCAAWAERDSRLGRLWDSTRPTEPTAEEWDGVWGRVADALERGEPAVARPLQRPGKMRRTWWIVAGVAQAAAVLLTVLYFEAGRREAVPRVAVTNRPSVTQSAEPVEAVTNRPSVTQSAELVEIDPGETIVIRERKGHIETVELALNGGAGQVDPAYEALNSLEAIAQ